MLKTEPAGPHEGWIKDVHSVGGSQHDHICRASVETVHLHQKLRRDGIDFDLDPDYEMLRLTTHLIEGVLSLRLSPNIATSSLSAYCVNLVDEKDTGRSLAGCGKHVPGNFDMETMLSIQ